MIILLWFLLDAFVVITDYSNYGGDLFHFVSGTYNSVSQMDKHGFVFL